MLNLGSTKQTAAKAHVCDNCLRRIEPGQRYVRARIVDGSDAWVWRSHDDCQAVSEILFREGIEGDDGMLFRVCDMDREERDIIARVQPDLAQRMWPKRVPA